MVTAKQKSIIDIHTKKINPNTSLKIDSCQITREQKKRQKRPTKTNSKQLTKWP